MSIKNECKKICKNFNILIDFNGKDWKKEFNKNTEWFYISISQRLSEEFIREFQDKVNWNNISRYQWLSESFMREFQNKINFEIISEYQKLSENFIREFKNKIDWDYISEYQKLSEKFIIEFKNKVNWNCISMYQHLSENFIKGFHDKINWDYISIFQKLSENFTKEFHDKIDINIQIENHHNKRSKEEIIKEMKLYAKEYGLKFTRNGYLYCYRKHDKFCRGMWNWTIIYNEVGKRYEDWRCNLDSNKNASFGLGIFPEGNVLVKVHWSDWGCWVSGSNKCRVFAFTLLEIN